MKLKKSFSPAAHFCQVFPCLPMPSTGLLDVYFSMLAIPRRTPYSKKLTLVWRSVEIISEDQPLSVPLLIHQGQRLSQTAR